MSEVFGSFFLDVIQKVHRHGRLEKNNIERAMQFPCWAEAQVRAFTTLGRSPCRHLQPENWKAGLCFAETLSPFTLGECSEGEDTQVCMNDETDGLFWAKLLLVLCIGHRILLPRGICSLSASQRSPAAPAVSAHSTSHPGQQSVPCTAWSEPLTWHHHKTFPLWSRGNFAPVQDADADWNLKLVQEQVYIHFCLYLIIF